MSLLSGRIVIVGGGTAGWLAALILRDAQLRAGQGGGGQVGTVTVVETSKIPTIGVGEGTTAVFRQMLKHLGLDEAEFMAATGATVKYGIRHRDWRRIGHHYDGPIDDPHLVAPGVPLAQYALASGRPLTEAHLFQALMDAGRAPVARIGDRLVPAGPFHHAYHFDQARAGMWLRSKARGVTRINAQVTGVQTGPAGITMLALEDGRRIEADLFLDCTGFRRTLIGSLGAQWMDYGDVLPVNRAMPFWLNHDPDTEIAPFTLAWAQGAGWMWQIPTRDRMGCGYVYSDLHTTPDQAQAEIEAALGHPIEPRADIPIRAGRLRAPWLGNTVALGLASSFLEPLEATSIHGTIVQLLLLAGWLDDPEGRARYNAAHARQVDDFRDFIRAHYLSERRDTGFWRDVAGSHPAALTDRLADWANRMPERSDFAPFPMRLPHVEEQLWRPVLAGLGLLDRGAEKQALGLRPAERRATATLHGELIDEYRKASQRCLGHREWLDLLEPLGSKADAEQLQH
ncbi:tryptophan 7-halogenase [Limimaricola sp. G21655-S1]|uniref:tryptophan halogenase family protein n=1 Tax=Limimaricola sp. G21655-S1 TaxID=3014768 RepID=UPI0022AF5A2E|nr:tryptophan halogenase family protein [Limimaricola sp. G21655-S1]MCZ4260682.1 tryptophan 7-halogenase [Limimaricola sp. G21655-S1]